ncbi:bifunctional protein-serine/threonine kinase/phosphatase [Colwellia sp. E2M01]|uniref:bifunctional protein-serine/threonine kinase/phosphatase n=1 Tax=Colwellia sp. E2M01 TaxID=2841561 RepID=UPI001C094128|nr:bifunctional protein-serine/threonine kinase/phosphatase [Colwellia sp. E2M01]MBU2869141.1 bifunctional protein-serine/threonine kinase/phosphatase [Colwellia sp. E2M01]
MAEHSSELSFTVAQRSVAGKKPQNEDAIGIRLPKDSTLINKGAVAVIADGVSAAEAGKEASETCVRNFLYDYYSTPESWSVKKSTSQVLTALNRWLYGQGQQYNDAQKGYISTFSTIIFKSQTGHIFHVGDTRIYRLRNGDLEQLTRDHSTYVNAKQTYLARAMGLDVKLDVDYKSIDLEVGDIYFLSTDGIHDFISHKDIAAELKILKAEDNEIAFEQACEKIIALGLKGGSGDNLSCQILRVDHLPTKTMNEVGRKLSELPFPPYLEEGVILDGYRVEKCLHINNRSQVYVVRDIDSNARYCMKTPSVNFDDDLAYIERFIMESWMGSRISNPHVVKVIENNKDKKWLYYLTEFIEGRTLEQWIKENPKPAVQDVVYILNQISKGLRAMHKREILHQDIKPGNIMIDNNGEATIIDFGSCYSKGIAEIATPLDEPGVLGTAGYSAPEVVITGKSTIQSEVFSLSVLAYEMLTGKEPFSGKLSKCRTSEDYLKTKYTPCFDENPLVPIWIDGAIKKGLRFNAERRHEDVLELMHELQTPNSKYKTTHNAALMDKNPLLFWQVMSGIWFTAFIIALVF